MIKIIGILGIFLIAMTDGCDFMSHTHCADKILTQEKSADGKYLAVLYHRSCANNTGLYTCVNLQDSSTTPLSKESEPIFTIRGSYEITATWTGPSSLEIKSEGLKNEQAILTQEHNWKTVNIIYKN